MYSIRQVLWDYYNIPRKIRELQFTVIHPFFALYYNIPRKIRELQSIPMPKANLTIITYQEKLGNYNDKFLQGFIPHIITYQEKLGNYNNLL